MEPTEDQAHVTPLISGTKYGRCPFVLDDGSDAEAQILMPGDRLVLSPEERERAAIAFQFAMRAAERVPWPKST